MISLFKQARESTKKYHTGLYSSASLYQKGTWLEKPEKDIIDICEKLQNSKNIRILDIGAGIGRNAIPLAQSLHKNNVTVECIDYLDIAIKKLQENARRFQVEKYIKGIVSTAEEFIIQKDSYDLILSHGVLAHVKNKKTLQRILDDIKQGVKPGGYVYLAIASDLEEKEVKTNKKHMPLVEVSLTSDELVGLYKGIFKDWEIEIIRKDPYMESYQQKGIDIEWKCVFTVVIAKRNF